MQTTLIEPIERIEDLKKGIIIPQLIFEEWLEKHDWTWHQLARGEFPVPFSSLEVFQLACLCDDPVLWCEAFLRHPDDLSYPWRFYDYQKKSIRATGHTVHEDGAEVGKTREIIAFSLYKAFTRKNGSGFMGAPLYTHLIEIIDVITDQLNYNPIFKGSLIHHRKAPHHHMKFANRFTIDFRPSGYDGTTFRGVHVKDFAILDEATKIKNPNTFKEFWRLLLPGCPAKIYSTPDGDRSTVYYRLCRRSEGKEIKEEEDIVHAKNLDFTFFNFSKELMPPPFWTPERRRFYIKQYGGEDSPGYQQNVLGQAGDPENSVFPWYQFERLLKDIPEYRCLKILIDDSQGEVSIFGTRYVSPYPLAGEEVGEGVKPQEQIICDRRLSKADFDIRTEIKSFFLNISGLKFGGADLGFSQDPTELYVKLIIGRTHKLIARLQLKGVSYDQQADAIDALDDIYDAGEHKMGWGVDFGNAGSAVVHILQNQERYFEKRYEDRLAGYQFASTYDAVDEEGEVLLNRHTKKPVKLTAKELATELLTKKMQRQELEYPYDPDIMLFYPNHTYHTHREGQHHRIYRKEDDHVIDADRCLTLRIILPGTEMEDIFACGN